MELTAVEIITLCTRHHAQIALNLACIWKVKGENRVSCVTASEVQKLRIKETNCIYICRMSIKEGITHTSYMYSPTPVIRTSVIRNLGYPNTVPNAESVSKKSYLH